MCFPPEFDKLGNKPEKIEMNAGVDQRYQCYQFDNFALLGSPPIFTVSTRKTVESQASLTVRGTEHDPTLQLVMHHSA
jgi:hypothetical protein